MEEARCGQKYGDPERGMAIRRCDHMYGGCGHKYGGREVWP